MPKENPSFEGFVAFIACQPAEKAIDHCDWESCAVGEYLENPGVIGDKFDACSFANSELPHDLLELLNTRGRNFDYRYPVDTYGDLFEFIEKFYPEAIDS